MIVICKNCNEVVTRCIGPQREVVALTYATTHKQSHPVGIDPTIVVIAGGFQRDESETYAENLLLPDVQS